MVTQNSMERSILDIKKKDKVRIETIKRKLRFNEDAWLDTYEGQNEAGWGTLPV